MRKIALMAPFELSDGQPGTEKRKRVDGPDRTPKVPAGLLVQLLLDALNKAKEHGHEGGELLYCGQEKSWEDCVTEEHVGNKTYVFLHFNLGAHSYCVRRSFNGGKTYVKRNGESARDGRLLQKKA